MTDDHDSCSSDSSGHSHTYEDFSHYDCIDASPLGIGYSSTRSRARPSYTARRRNDVCTDASAGIAIIGVMVLVSLVLWALWAAGAFA
jgi:hypothetical protein